MTEQARGKALDWEASTVAGTDCTIVSVEGAEIAHPPDEFEAIRLAASHLRETAAAMDRYLARYGKV